MTSKVMEQKPVADWKTGWDIATILEALKEYYPLATSDNFVSSYEKWYLLYKSMRSSIGLLRKLYSEHLITSFSDIGDMPVEHEVTLLSKFSKVFTNFHYPHKDWGSNKSFPTDLSDALDKDEAYKAEPSLMDLLRVTQVIMNKWEKDHFQAQGSPPPTTPSAHVLMLRLRPRTSRRLLANTARAVDALAKARRVPPEGDAWVEQRGSLGRLQGLQSHGRRQHRFIFIQTHGLLEVRVQVRPV